MTEYTGIKAKLEARREDLIAEMKTIDERLREPEPKDDEDRATEREEDEVLEGLGNSAEEELELIDDALKRIDLGTYGDCTHCGKSISHARLEALPHTNHCIDCASEAETH